jgi:hypothetical protein
MPVSCCSGQDRTIHKQYLVFAVPEQAPAGLHNPRHRYELRVESLLSKTWAAVCRQSQDIRMDLKSFKYPTPMVSKGTLNYHRNPDSSAVITDITFFDLNYQFIKTDGNSSPKSTVPGNSPFDAGTLDAEQRFPNI